VFQLVGATLFLIGAIFMLVNTFTDAVWSFWVGLSFAVVAAAFYILIVLENKKILSKKLSDSSYSDKADNKNSHEKIENAQGTTPENKVSKD